MQLPQYDVIETLIQHFQRLNEIFNLNQHSTKPKLKPGFASLSYITSSYGWYSAKSTVEVCDALQCLTCRSKAGGTLKDTFPLRKTFSALLSSPFNEKTAASSENTAAAAASMLAS